MKMRYLFGSVLFASILSLGTLSSQGAVEPSEGTLTAFDVRKDFTINPFTFFRENPPILLAGDREGYNAMTIGWGTFGVLWDPPMRRPTVTVYVAQKRYTREFMESKKRFTIMQFKDPEVWRFMGRKSGRDTDKAKELGLTVAYTEKGTPYFLEADLVLECETMYGAEFKPEGFRNDVPKNMYKNFPAGIHSEYIGEIISAMKRK